ncbi:hypothetical protein TV39_14725 [Arthrobacter sp. SPG23]|nr:hypothetical protein TV39_14725 [Arthrobacter sp. SPG23]
MQHQCGAVGQGLLQHRAGKGVVHQYRHAVSVTRELSDVHQFQAGVGGRLHHHQSRVRSQGRTDSVRRRERHLGAQDARGQDVVAAAVERPHRHHVLPAGSHSREEDCRQRGHPGGKGHRLGSAFEHGHALLEAGHGGIPQALVDGALAFQRHPAAGHLFIGPAAVVDGRKRRSGGEVNRHGVHALVGEAGTACMDSQ